MEVHELEEDRRYLSTRVDEGMDLVIFTTQISEKSVEEHEAILDQKVSDYMAEMLKQVQHDENERDDFVPRNDCEE